MASRKVEIERAKGIVPPPPEPDDAELNQDNDLNGPEVSDAPTATEVSAADAAGDRTATEVIQGDETPFVERCEPLIIFNTNGNLFTKFAEGVSQDGQRQVLWGMNIPGGCLVRTSSTVLSPSGVYAMTETMVAVDGRTVEQIAAFLRAG